MAEHEISGAGYVDLQAAATEYAGGRSEVTVCYWVWDLRFCPISSAEWLTNPLTKDQAYHICYFMDMNTAFIRKIGLDKLPVKHLF